MITYSANETEKIGLKMGSKLKGGEVLAMEGDLGSGKTTFLKGLARALNIKETITSPTFVILKPYLGKIDHKPITLVHIDAYRIENEQDIISVGIEDYLGRDDVVMAIEWAEKINDLLINPKRIKFKRVNENEREIIIDSID